MGTWYFRERGRSGVVELASPDRRLQRKSAAGGVQSVRSELLFAPGTDVEYTYWIDGVPEAAVQTTPEHLILRTTSSVSRRLKDIEDALSE